MVSGRSLAAIVIAGAAVVAGIISWLDPPIAVPTLVGVFAGIPAGVLTSWLVTQLQKPKLVISGVPGGTVGNLSTYWVHLKVTNTADPFLGAGTAHDVRARVRILSVQFDLGGQSAGATPGVIFELKWTSKPDPITQQFIGLREEGRLAALGVVDPRLFDEAKTETIRPRRSADIGLAFKMANDVSCYIHRPENFRFREWKNPACRLGPGTHRLLVTVECEEGVSASSVFDLICGSSEMVPSTDQHVNNETLYLTEVEGPESAESAIVQRTQ